MHKGDSMKKNGSDRKVVPNRKELGPITDKQKKLLEVIGESPFVFGESQHPFVPVYGPFAWTPEPDRCTMHASDRASLERL